MRIQILCQVGAGLILPINYNHFLAAAIYRFLQMSDQDYADFLHDQGYEADQKRFKLFTFSQLTAQQRQLRGDQIHFLSQISWQVSSPSQPFLQNLANSLMTQGHLQIDQQRVRIQDVRVLPSPRYQSVMKFTCLSPLTISTRREYQGQLSRHYCLPDDPQLPALVQQNLSRKFQAIHGQLPSGDQFDLTFDPQYLQRRKGKVTKLIRYKNVDVRAILCPFTVAGSVELIQVGYETGFGNNNSAGFGMARYVPPAST